MIINSFPGTLGLANDKGYMTKEIFLDVMKHFVKCSGSSKENPTLLLIDNVETHLSVNAINFAREYGVTLFTFPPHCTHKLQPLDVGIFSPFKSYYDNAINSWIISNPGLPVTIYHIAGFVREALSKAATPLNIIASFEKPGIFPFNRSVFQDSDYIMSKVTEQQDPNERASNLNETETTNNENYDASAESQQAMTSEVLTAIPVSDISDAIVVTTGPTINTSDSFITPVDFKGYPKAQPKQKNRKPKRKGKCMIATDSPEKNEIQEHEKQQMEKKLKAEERKRQRKSIKEKPKEVQAKKGKYKRERIQRVLDFDKTSNDLNPEINLVYKKDDIGEINMSSEDDNAEVVTKCFPPLAQSPVEGDYVLVVLGSKKEKYFVGKILKEEDNDGDLEISYLKKTNYDKRFVQPSVPDIHSVNILEIKMILPKPSYSDNLTGRQKAFLMFDYNFSNIHLG